jgi:hypothetical protein
VREFLACQKLCWRFPLALEAVAPLQPTVVEEELKQDQVIGPQLAVEEKVARRRLLRFS